MTTVTQTAADMLTRSAGRFHAAPRRAGSGRGGCLPLQRRTRAGQRNEEKEENATQTHPLDKYS